VKGAVVEQGFRDCEQRMRVLKSSVVLKIEDGITRLEKQGRLKGDFIVRPIDDAVYPS
jgi:transposase-like protein